METHASVMADYIKKFNWGEELSVSPEKDRIKNKHERIKYRLITFFEQKIWVATTIWFSELQATHGKKLIKAKDDSRWH